MAEGWYVEELTCRKCGSCVDLCPNRIIQKDTSGKIQFLDERVESCFRCGHCMAVCPTKSIQIPGLSYDEDFYPQPEFSGLENEQFVHLINSRRAVRSFQDRPVPHEMLEKVVQAIQSAPPGFPPIKTELTVIQNPDMMKKSLPLMIDLYEYLLKAMKNPVVRQVIQKSVGREKFITLKNHVVPLLIDRMPDLKSGREDTILRRAPAMILFHADRDCENFKQDIYIALTYGFLAAQSLGLGASAMDLIPPAVDKSKALRELFQIPENNEVVGAIIMGFPKHRFQRGIKRDLKSVTWL
jgi:ferredoxin